MTMWYFVTATANELCALRISCLHWSSSPITGVLHLLLESKSIGIHEIPTIPQNQIHGMRQTSAAVRIYETIIHEIKYIQSKFITQENFQLSCCSEICKILYTYTVYL